MRAIEFTFYLPPKFNKTQHHTHRFMYAAYAIQTYAPSRCVKCAPKGHDRARPPHQSQSFFIQASVPNFSILFNMGLLRKNTRNETKPCAYRDSINHSMNLFFHLFGARARAKKHITAPRQPRNSGCVCGKAALLEPFRACAFGGVSV